MTRLRKLYHILFFALTIIIVSCSRAAPRTIVVTRVVVVEGQETVITELVPQTATPAADGEDEAPRHPVTLDLSYLGSLPNIDPQTTTDAEGIDLVENLFVGLTNFNHATNNIESELAESWEVSVDGRTWIFNLRDDIYWVRPNENDEMVDGLLQAEAVRPVTALSLIHISEPTRPY